MKRIRGLNHDYFEMSVTLHHETEAALLVSDNGRREDAVWIPKSQCEDINHVGEAVEIVIPDWLATEKNLA